MGKFDRSNFGKGLMANKGLSEKAELHENKEKFDIRFIDISKIIPNPYNKEIYELSGIESLAENIKKYGLTQNLEVNEVEIDGEKLYRIIGGHRRFEAIQLLNSQGEEFNKIPCKVERNLTELEEKIRLLKSNSDTRELTPKEKRLQTEALKELLINHVEATGEKIAIQKEIAKQTGQDPKTVMRYNNINEKLIPELQEYFDNEKISFTEAYKFATLDEQAQLTILNLLKEKDKVTKEELAVIKETNKKLVEEANEKDKKIDELRSLKDKLSIEINELEDKIEQNSIEQEAIEEEKEKLEKKIREEIASLTEEELNKIKEELEKTTLRAKDLEAKEEELKNKIKVKDEEHEKALNELKENIENNNQNNIKLSEEELAKEVAKVKIHDMKVEIIKDIVMLGNVIKNNKITEDVEGIANEISSALYVLTNKVNNAINDN